MSSKNCKKPKASDPSESESGSDSENSVQSTPPRKDAKTTSKKGNDSASKSSSADSSKAKPSKSLRVHGESEPTWELGSKKFITIGDFKGKTYVNIREYYEKDGKVLPGKKGIGLNIEQWQNLCSSIEEVNKTLNK